MLEVDSSDDRSLRSIVDELLAVLTDDVRVAAVSALISDPTSTPARLLELIPPHVLRLAMATASQPHFQSLVDSYPDLAERLATARRLVLASFPGLALSSAIPATGLAESQDQGANDSLRNLGAVSHAKVWLGEPPVLAPVVQLVVTDDAGGRVFDQVIDWTDLLFLAESTLTVLKESIDAGATLVQPEIVREFLDSLPDEAGKITVLLQELVDAAAAYDR
ncbi:MAG TPA: hypothetical protein VEK57_13150 [Thermoanaerobaculia bacterium]|nr:hypothetical protein [Thermoanaerobaculia bacterium]